MLTIYVTLARWFRFWAEWLDPLPIPIAVEPIIIHGPDFTLPEYKRAKDLVKSWMGIKCSGDFKRHQVYAKLQKDFPLIPKRQLSLTIERIMETLP